MGYNDKIKPMTSTITGTTNVNFRGKFFSVMGDLDSELEIYEMRLIEDTKDKDGHDQAVVDRPAQPG
jgi:hypothetical protein